MFGIDKQIAELKSANRAADIINQELTKENAELEERRSALAKTLDEAEQDLRAARKENERLAKEFRAAQEANASLERELGRAQGELAEVKADHVEPEELEAKPLFELPTPLEIWVRAWAATASASDCKDTDTASRYADACLEGAEKRFNLKTGRR